MRLFLSSENLGNFPEIFLKMVGEGKLGITENAKDDWDEPSRAAKVQEHINQLKGQGFNPEEIDLRKYFGNPDKLQKKLEEFTGLFAFGGNSFILRKAFSYSGLDKLLTELLAKDKVVYGGSSAGAILATPSLKESAHGDEPDKTPTGYKSEIIWDGLSLVPFYVVPHYKSEWWGSDAVKMEDILRTSKASYYVLEDGEVLIVDNEKVEFMT